MPKKKKSKKKLTPLEAVMEWAFRHNHSKSLKEDLNLDVLLAKAKRNPDLAWKALPVGLQKRLKDHDRKVLAEALKVRGYRNAMVHSSKVLRFMSDLFHRRSEIPPPWVT